MEGSDTALAQWSGKMGANMKATGSIVGLQAQASLFIRTEKGIQGTGKCIMCSVKPFSKLGD